jgi:hypothetical protein
MTALTGSAATGNGAAAAARACGLPRRAPSQDMPPLSPIDLTIHVACGTAQQQAALDDWLAAHADVNLEAGDGTGACRYAVIAEGALLPLAAAPGVVIERIAAGCGCCVGTIVLRVTLARLLRRHRPAALLLLIAGGEHRERVRRLLLAGELGVQFVDRENDG